MYCTHCGQEIDERKNCICTYCRYPLGEGQYSPPEGFAYDLKSGWYYQSTQEVDGTTGQPILKALWFHPTSGEYKTAVYPAPKSRQASTQPVGATISDQSPRPIPTGSGKRKGKSKIMAATLLVLLLGGGGFSVWYFELYTFLPFFSETRTATSKTQEGEYRVGSLLGEVQLAEDPNAPDQFTLLALDTKLKDKALLTSTDSSFCTISLDSENRLALDRRSSAYIVRDKNDVTVHLISGNILIGEVPVQPAEAKIVTQIGEDVCLSTDKGSYSVHLADDGNWMVYAYNSTVEVLDGKRKPISKLKRGSCYTLDGSGNLLEDRTVKIDYGSLPGVAQLTLNSSVSESSTGGNPVSTVKPDSPESKDEASDSSAIANHKDGIVSFQVTEMLHPERGDHSIINHGYDPVGVDGTNNIYLNYELKNPGGKCMAVAISEANEENALGYAHELVFFVASSPDSVAAEASVKLAATTTDSPMFFHAYELGLDSLPVILVVIDEKGQLTNYDFCLLQFTPVYQ